MNATPVVRGDFKDIEQWFIARNLAMPEPWAFSTIGLIVEDVAAGWLYVTNSGCAMLDCYISNPKADHSSRKQALKQITKGLMKMAKNHGAQMILCNTKIDAIGELAESFGFRSDGVNSMFSKAL
jgi:hypothetical protein